MTSLTQDSDHARHVSDAVGLSRIGVVCKQILNILGEMSNRSVDRSRFAMLPMRQLEDIGMTPAERDAALR
jgi:hypothetical protein